MTLAELLRSEAFCEGYWETAKHYASVVECEEFGHFSPCVILPEVRETIVLSDSPEVKDLLELREKHGPKADKNLGGNFADILAYEIASNYPRYSWPHTNLSEPGFYVLQGEERPFTLASVTRDGEGLWAWFSEWPDSLSRIDPEKTDIRGFRINMGDLDDEDESEEEAA